MSRGPYIIQVGERPSPFQQSERLQAWVGDGHVVQHAALAVAFGDRAEADAVAALFDLAEVQDVGGLYVQALDTLAIMACATPADFMAHLKAPPSRRQHDRQRWMRAVCSRDDRCPLGWTDARVPMWALRDEGQAPAQEATHGRPAPRSP